MEKVDKRSSFARELSILINKHSEENSSDTPDFILATFLQQCLDNFNDTTNRRKAWYSRQSFPAPSLREASSPSE